mmetsp:Transcript_4565/g.10257  ORF Transcript_4565/g.10257 Transcript_4565/m.10257 type:complete len:219 (-) Transcript_4565:185-841(-)
MAAVFIAGFDYDTPESIVREHFGAVGHVTSVRLGGKGSAVVTYDQTHDAERAVEELDKSTMEGNRRYVSVRLDAKGEGKGKSNGKGKGTWNRKGSDYEDAPHQGDMQEGVVASFFEEKGFGFITPDDGSEDVFVHRKCNGEDRSAYLEEGDKVTYELEWNDQKQKYSASSCTGFKSGGGGGGGGGGSWGGGGGSYGGGGGYGGGKGYSPYDGGKGGKW